jgi:hypothetical protein
LICRKREPKQSKLIPVGEKSGDDAKLEAMEAESTKENGEPVAVTTGGDDGEPVTATGQNDETTPKSRFQYSYK